METMSPQQQNELSRRTSLTGESKTSTQHEHKRRMKSLSHRRQSAPSLVINKALTRSRTFSRESFLVPVCLETCPLVQSFLCPDRAFLLHGHVTLKTGLQTQDRDLFLFTDILIIAKSKSPTHFKLKAQVCVGEMWTAQCMEDVCEGSTNPERSFVMGWPTCNCVVTFSSEVQKERWLSMLKSRLKEEKEKDEPKTIPLKVFGKGIGSCAQVVSKTLGVSNSDSTNEVVRLALQQFGVTSCVKDYQLWVSSKRDNAPYPLIGHEFPFSIQMSHMREPLAQPGRRDTVPPPDRQRAMHRDQVQVDKQCQFILKTRCSSTTTTPVIVDPAQKPFKRRRSLINWAFWKGSNPNLHSSSTNLSSPAPGYLFGQSLSTICWDNSLPKPVMDMLVFLYNEGPFTRGIFRRSAGARACRELRDRLDSGAQDVPLSREHVFIIAAVFKDFLRNIPGSLLCSDLYEQWMDVMEEAESEEAEEEEQAQDITRLIGLLPKENTLLLRHVVAVLHGIQENAHDNQMNAFNLSVCIAPSMLWAPGPSSPEVEGEGAKKVCDLVRYMIEHCQEVLGEDVTSVFGGLPRKRAESDRPLTVKELREIHSQACAASNTGYDVTNQGNRTPPQHVFFGQGGPSLSLARQKSHSLAPGMEGLSGGRCSQRRSSEPGAAHLGEALVLDKASHPERLHREAKLGQRSKSVDGSQDLGLKVSCTDQSGAPKFCLSPSATKAVRDYFSPHTHSNPNSGQRWR
nr:rho GTPase-activating protein 20-like [Oncorhynchus nerka]